MTRLRYAYYPGCSQIGTSADYDASTRAVCRQLDIELAEIEDWSCCGSTPAHKLDYALSGALSARNLVQAAKTNCTEATTGCPSCLSNLRSAAHRMQKDDFKAKVNSLLDEPCETPLQTRSILQIIFEGIGADGIKGATNKPLKGLKVAPYYGCILTRPAEVMKFDDVENPMSMDALLKAAGAEVVPFPLKVECCGASYGVPRKDLVTTLSNRLLAAARDCGADCVAVACPLCQMNLDLRQSQINSANNENYDIPVFYFTQLLGLAFGLDRDELGLDKLAVNPEPVLSRIGKTDAE